MEKFLPPSAFIAKDIKLRNPEAELRMLGVPTARVHTTVEGVSVNPRWLAKVPTTHQELISSDFDSTFPFSSTTAKRHLRSEGCLATCGGAKHGRRRREVCAQKHGAEAAEEKAGGPFPRRGEEGPWHGSAGEAPPRRYVRIPGRGSPQAAAPPPPGGVRHATGAEEILLGSQPSYREALAEGKLQVAHVEYLRGWLQKKIAE